ncbi:hypothetical protein QJ854_gp567 [Moumouvirus goulette]|uniref:RING-type domain-containing protein n=1 Tax=Moumouvirus goulette TaxID=1247379 RepID=M1NME7_9VIRU|nr:hypothetical protein QJ854_gp567 [Moumouvirus goulette]AGF85215.1 hypothetical protein glt_00406 [Moumouvirus goulette]
MYDVVYYQDLESIRIKNLKIKNYERVILHECYVIDLPIIKKIIRSIKINCIWIINSLPIKFYFNEIKNSSINNLFSYLNIWLNFSETVKNKHKIDAVKHIYTNLNDSYFIMKYPEKIYTTLPIKPSNIEQLIHDFYIKIYNNWINNLTNNPNNIYSSCSKEKNKLIKTKIFNSIILLSTAVINKETINIFFHEKVKKILQACEKTKNQLENCYNKYKYADQITYIKLTQQDIININEIMDDIKKKINVDKIISNYTRYNRNEHYKIFDEKCPICYGEEEIIKTKLICGHDVCLECIMNIIPNSKYCPICNEYINLNKIAIITNEKESDLIKLLNDTEKNTLILTNISINTNYLSNEINIINFTKNNTYTKILQINNIKNIIVLTTPKKYMSKKDIYLLDKIISHYEIFNKLDVKNIILQYENSEFYCELKNNSSTNNCSIYY